MDTLTVCPNTLVPVVIPPQGVQGMSLNGWTFTSKPNIPYQKSFKVTLYGLKWYLNPDGTFDTTTNPNYNARALELFYEKHGNWNPFLWTHPNLGVLQVRFNAPLSIPEGLENSDGLIDKFDMMLIHHNPAFA